MYLPIQGNDPSCNGPLCDINSVCTYLLDEVCVVAIGCVNVST